MEMSSDTGSGKGAGHSSKVRAAVALLAYALLAAALKGTDVLVLDPPHAGAAELMLLGKPFDAEKAVAAGFVNEIVPPESLLERAVRSRDRQRGLERTAQDRIALHAVEQRDQPDRQAHGTDGVEATGHGVAHVHTRDRDR